jgi:DNA-binding MarR family transcriptional regulator
MKKDKKKSKVSDNTYISIGGWMVTKLKLKGLELLIYAIIYGYSKDNQGKFIGSLEYLAQFTNSTKQGVMKTLKLLVDKGLIKKIEIEKNNVKFCQYIHASDYGGMKLSSTDNDTDSTTEFNGCTTEFTGGDKQSLPNNNILYTKDINNNNNKSETQKLKSWDEIKDEQGIMEFKDLIQEAINDTMFVERLCMQLGQEKKISVEIMKCYIYAIYSHWKHDIKVTHNNRSDLRRHLMNTIKKDIYGDNFFYKQAILIHKQKQNK